MPGVPPQHELPLKRWSVGALERWSGRDDEGQAVQRFNVPTFQHLYHERNLRVADARTGTSITNVSGAPTGPTADRSGAGAAPEPPTSPAPDRGAGGRGGRPPPPACCPADRGPARPGRPPGVAPASPS